MEATIEASPLEELRDVLRARNFYDKKNTYSTAFYQLVNVVLQNWKGRGREALDILLQEQDSCRRWRETWYENELLDIALARPEYRLEILPYLTHAGRSKNLIAAYIATNPGHVFNTQQIALLCVTVLAGVKGVAIGDIARTHQLIARQYSLNERTQDRTADNLPDLAKALQDLTQEQFDPTVNAPALIRVFGTAVTVLKETIPQINGSVETFVGAEASRILLRLTH